MLRKRRNTIILLVGFIALVYFLYIGPFQHQSSSNVNIELVKRVKELKEQLSESQQVISSIESQISDIEKGKIPNRHVVEGGSDPHPQPIVISNRGKSEQESYDLSLVSASGQVCTLAESPQPKTDIQMFNVLDTISFADVDGGVWKQGYPIHIQESQWTAVKPLKVFVIPHSHCDPGWLKTFDGYYNAQVKHILDNMVTKLGQHEKMTFIYAEISFFSTWWSGASTSQKEAVLRFIREGRFELVTGGWVMPDEAASHYWALLDQLVEGHSWIRENIGTNAIPRSGWSIDPFGHTSTMAYILGNSGLRNMLIQRVHYSVKKHFAQNKYLEFNWRQAWDADGSTDILCHMMPFYSYDVPHTCGPDPKICCQFDFQRLPGGKNHCPWRKEPQAITESNVQDRASTLLDQYRKKSSLYKSNVVLIPLGDDFRYDSADEWDKQYTNYQKLFTFMNQQNDWHVQAQFGTLSDYFNEMRKEMGQSDETKSALEGIPSLSGDFYTYADRVDHYWSGYFTSRPFYKHWDRHLESTLRSAEIIFSMAQAKSYADKNSDFRSQDMYEKLTYARRSLGLFQHHDGITGTAKSAVMADYGQRMLRGWKSAYEVLRRSAQMLLAAQFDISQDMFDLDWIKDTEDSLEIKKVYRLTIGERKKLVIYNSLPHERVELVRIWVSRVPVSIYSPESLPVICQISPFFTTKTSVAGDKFKLSFLAKVPALGMVTYNLEASESHPCTISSVAFYNYDNQPAQDGVFNPSLRKDTKFTIHNHQIQVDVSTDTGMMQSITEKKTNHQHPVEMNFIKYISSTQKDHAGGAYLFIPSGGAQVVHSQKPVIRLVIGNLFHEVHSFTSLVEHTIRVVNTPGPESLGVEVVNIDSIKTQDNTELGMQLSSEVKNADETDAIFYTDLNGFTLHKRKMQSKLQLQGNVYPMTSMSYIESDETRLTVLAAQSAGVVSLTPGVLQVMLDRRLNQDDNRGLGEAVRDTKTTESKFFIIVERKTSEKKNDKSMGYPSMTSNILYQHMVSSLISLPLVSGEIKHTLYQPLTKSFPCELNLLNLRSSNDPTNGKVKSDSLMLVHHQATDCNLPTRGLTCTTNDGEVDTSDIFRHLKIKKFEKRTLTDLEMSDSVQSLGLVQVKPMHIAAYKLTL